MPILWSSVPVFPSLPLERASSRHPVLDLSQVLEMTADFMKKPFRLLVRREDLSLQGIRQYYVSVEKDSASIACAETASETES